MVDFILGFIAGFIVGGLLTAYILSRAMLPARWM